MIYIHHPLNPVKRFSMLTTPKFSVSAQHTTRHAHDTEVFISGSVRVWGYTVHRGLINWVYGIFMPKLGYLVYSGYITCVACVLFGE